MSRNRQLKKMRDLFKEAGFNFHLEFIDALNRVDPRTRLEALVSVAPYFMARLSEEAQPVDSEDQAPQVIEIEAVKKLSNDELLQIALSGQEKTGQGSKG